MAASVQWMAGAGIISVTREFSSRTVTERPVSEAIFRAAFSAARSSVYSSTITLPFPENAAGFDTVRIINGTLFIANFGQSHDSLMK